MIYLPNASVRLCSKPGCGAPAKIGRPCTDYNCPQRYVKSEEYQKLEEELNQLKRENEYLWNKH